MNKIDQQRLAMVHEYIDQAPLHDQVKANIKETAKEDWNHALCQLEWATVNHINWTLSDD